MLQIQNQCDQWITLYRGERATRKPAIARSGISATRRWVAAGFPDPTWIRLVRGADFVPLPELNDAVHQHVALKRKPSPLVSYTDDPAKAEQYALGEESNGILISVQVHLVRSFAYQAFMAAGGFGAGLHVDEQGWLWVEVAAFAPTTGVGQFDPRLSQNGIRDREFLGLRDFAPGELNIEDVRRSGLGFGGKMLMVAGGALLLRMLGRWRPK